MMRKLGLILFLSLAFLCSHNFPCHAGSPVATVLNVREGIALYQMGENKGEAVAPDDLLYEGDSIELRGQATLVILYGSSGIWEKIKGPCTVRIGRASSDIEGEAVVERLTREEREIPLQRLVRPDVERNYLTRSPPRTRGATRAPEEKSDLWIVSPFGERIGWLERTDLLPKKRSGYWGLKLATYIEAALKNRSLRSLTVEEKLTEGKIKMLIGKGLRYAVNGYIRALKFSDGGSGAMTGELTAVFRLRKILGDELVIIKMNSVVEKRSLDEKRIVIDIDLLFEDVAEAIAKRIVEIIPSDLLATSG
jgi:hypothetical protein